MRHGRKSFVEQLDFLTSLGHGPTGRERRALGLADRGAVADRHRSVHDAAGSRDEGVRGRRRCTPGVDGGQVRENTGWPIRFAADVRETPPPTAEELAALRDLNARTARAHGVVAAGVTVQ